ncbi:CRP-like cAMP-binding protein [Neorhizobium sp. 2083]|uniref:Crp/Fnr family transcriptional regulator n=1 Tax=Neorhizobium sp. 2083 TaxID=2817762 RepID=UPI0028671CC0|nr:helix-turn-helix domain-containing protein [Neorhizobium sp. 2083]MDR6821119.1 CRP-like cAMP-binding protein [Neorhizobium sp. 2083]
MFINVTAGIAAPVHCRQSSTNDPLPRYTCLAAQSPILLPQSGSNTTLRILDGCVALYQELSNGRRLILDILGPGRILSDALIDLRYCRAISLTSSRIEFIDASLEKDTIDRAMRQMLSRAQAHAMLLGRKTATERVATAILDLADQFARPSRMPANSGKTTFTLPLMRADIADWLGLTLETVSRRFSAFKRARLIAFDHPEIITIRDRQALEALAGTSQYAAKAA